MQRTIRAAILALGIAMTPAAVAQRTLEGDIAEYLGGVSIPDSKALEFREPPAADMEAFRRVVRAVLEQRLEEGARLAAPLGYELILLRDPARGRVFHILREAGSPLRGLGTYVFRPGACRMLVFEAPHAGGDTNTLPQSVRLFVELDAFALLVAGTHRCASNQPSPCDGVTSVCTGREERYPVSDVAHYAGNFFQPVHEEVMTKFTQAIAVSMHGFSWQQGDPDLILSTGACRRTEPSMATLLAGAYNRFFTNAAISLRAGSCQQSGGPVRLCAQTNLQARFLAGNADICACAQGGSTCSAASACVQGMAFPERFLHIEQSCALRQMSGCTRPERVPYESSVEVFRSLFPCHPHLKAVVNAASFEEGPAAPRSLVSLFGEHFGAAPQVRICGEPARVLSYAPPGQLNALVPDSARPGGQCVVEAGLGEEDGVPLISNVFAVRVVEQNIRLFLHEGRAIVTRGAELLGVAKPARRGEVVTLWGTGGGALREGAPGWLAPLVRQPVVRIGGLEARVLYAGAAPGFAGLDQYNVEVPAGAGAGDLSLEIGGRQYSLQVE